MSYSATSRIRAHLPSTQQWGELELEQSYSAPRSLQFQAFQFVGDKFVKTNVIASFLQSELDYVQKDDSVRTALTTSNYEFSTKGSTMVDGRRVHVFRVKPRHKYVGLFKGRIYPDAATGTLVRRRLHGQISLVLHQEDRVRRGLRRLRTLHVSDPPPFQCPHPHCRSRHP